MIFRVLATGTLGIIQSPTMADEELPYIRSLLAFSALAETLGLKPAYDRLIHDVAFDVASLHEMLERQSRLLAAIP